MHCAVPLPYTYKSATIVHKRMHHVHANMSRIVLKQRPPPSLHKRPLNCTNYAHVHLYSFLNRFGLTTLDNYHIFQPSPSTSACKRVPRLGSRILSELCRASKHPQHGPRPLGTKPMPTKPTVGADLAITKPPCTPYIILPNKTPTPCPNYLGQGLYVKPFAPPPHTLRKT